MKKSNTARTSNMRALPVLMLLLLLLLSATAISSSVSGPGLRPSRVVLPCRYFWITKEEKEDDDDKTSSRCKLE